YNLFDLVFLMINIANTDTQLEASIDPARHLINRDGDLLLDLLDISKIRHSETNVKRLRTIGICTVARNIDTKFIFPNMLNDYSLDLYYNHIRILGLRDSEKLTLYVFDKFTQKSYNSLFRLLSWRRDFKISPNM